MSHAFDSHDDQASFLVLVNRDNQHSLWPGYAGLPAGWRAVHGPGTRQDCLRYVERHWSDMRPASVARGSPAPPQ
ncbi:MbtH family protein [Eleftheria terrae]|uniref:MbtH family protein n=1 Tax=Eleftheria terrae TaxID=1597781 RepID=UPI00263B2F2D|nr:MbtH family protein [Eleftheria terrae]WKB53038.1 MbtH family protein [Eleftheria terrae]